MTRRRKQPIRSVAPLLVALVVASCTADRSVETESADSIGGSTLESERGVPPVAEEPVGTTPDGLPSLSTPDPETLTGTLDNGLRYLVRANDNPGGKAELRLAVDAGSVLEDEMQRGAAHFVEHMLFNGTERFPENELIDVLRSFGASFGADINASTSYDETIYGLTVPNDDDVVGTGLDVLEDWLSFATIAGDDVEAERGIVLDEWRSRSQTAEGRVTEAFAEFVLAGTAYEDRSPIGGREAIETMTPDALRTFYDDWYRPDNAAVIVVGDIDPGRVEEWIVERFGDAGARGADVDRIDPPLDDAPVNRVEVVADPELTEGSLSVNLPLIDAGFDEVESELRQAILEGLAFDVVANRLENDALSGTAPFERAAATSASLVRDLDSPGITVDVEGSGVGASVEAIVDEFERIDRFGISDSELDRAVGVRRTESETAYDGRESRQDASFADEYVRHVLTGEPFVTAEQEFAFRTAVLDAATPASVADAFRDRYASAGVEAFVAVRSDEAGDVAEPALLADLIDEADRREIVPRDEDAGVADELLSRPEPIEEVDRMRLAERVSTEIIDPVVLEFANGARVALNRTPIVEGQVFFEARSPGGLATVSDEDVADAQLLGPVLAESGAGALGPVELDTFLDDTDVALQTSIDPYTDSMMGVAATDDLEILLQLVHLLMTEPRADDAAVERAVDDLRPLAEDPSIDAGYALQAALLDARYDDPRFLFPTPEALDTVDVDGIERVATERFGGPDDWSFSLSGDLDLDEASELVRAYLGTVPSADELDPTEVTQPPPPDGRVVVDVEAGQGDAANVAFLFTGTASADRRDDLVARVVGEVVGGRLLDVVREELGGSYSPFATVDLGDGVEPAVETFISVSTTPALVAEVSAVVLGELDTLRVDGPSSAEFAAAVATVGEQLDFVSDAQINDEVLDVLVDAAGNPSFDDFVAQAALIDQVTEDEVQKAIQAWIPASDHIEVRVAPAG